MAIDETLIRATLARVLQSPGFIAAPNLAAFLRYVVEETLEGRCDRLKAYTIAVAALDRAESFDPNDNPLVRVQARRLRSALARFYETDGAEEPVVIELPVGSYVPHFTARAVAAAAASTESPAPTPRSSPTATAPRPPRRGGRAALAALLLVILTGLAGLGWIRWEEYREVAARTALVERDFEPGVGLDASRVLPLLVVDIDAAMAPIAGFDAESYRRRIEAFVERFDDMVVLSHRSPDFPAPVGQPLYRFHLGFVRDNANGYYQLIHAGDERVVRSGAVRFTAQMKYPHRAGSTFDTPDDLDAVRTIVEANGTISLDTARLDDISDPLACLVMGNLFSSDRNETLHRAARTCLETTIAANPRLEPAYALLGELYLREYRSGFDRLPGDPLTRAEATLRRAIALAPNSATPRHSLAEVLLLRGDPEAALGSSAGAVDLNPEDMLGLAQHGTVLARLGRADEAVALLRRAEANLASSPSWIADHLFLALDGLGRTEEADRTVGDGRLSHSALHLAATAIAAQRRDAVDTAATAIAALIALDPAFRDDPLTAWHRRGFAPTVADRLVAGLRLAGLPAPRP